MPSCSRNVNSWSDAEATLGSGFFAPHHYDEGRFDILTEEIYSRFGTTYDHPREVFRMAGVV